MQDNEAFDFFIFYFYFLFGAGCWAQGLMHAKQALFYPLIKVSKDLILDSVTNTPKGGPPKPKKQP